MLEHFSIFTKSGIVLWSHTWAVLKNPNPVDTLISTVLIQVRLFFWCLFTCCLFSHVVHFVVWYHQDKSADSTFRTGNYALRWTLANEFDLVFVAVYQKLLSLLFLEELLEVAKRKFCSMFVANGRKYDCYFTQN